MIKSGALNGLTVLRFAHAFASGGGMERILADLDQVLLARNTMTIIRMYIASNPSEMEERIELHGSGRLILVPLALPEGESNQLAPDHETRGKRFSQLFRNRVLYHPLFWSLGFNHYVRHRRLRRRKGEVVGAGFRFSDLCQRHAIDLCMMHFFGSSDADEVIQAARAHRIPFALENHYANDRFLHLSIRKHAMLADGVAGMNGLDVPAYLGNRYCNLADGIDISFFDRHRAVIPANAPAKPLIFLPSRIIRPKGHLDVVSAVASLRQRGLDIAVAFAGRIESSGFLRELRSDILQRGLNDSIHFLGELNPTALRDWYAASSVLVFPTYHHEGLGRIIVEAQSMEVPVVAYATGGVPEGLVDGVTGFLVSTGNIEALVAKLELLLRDPERGQRMGKAGRLFVADRYSLEALAARHETFYLGLLRK